MVVEEGLSREFLSNTLQFCKKIVSLHYQRQSESNSKFTSGGCELQKN